MEPRSEIAWPSTVRLAVRAVLGFAIAAGLLLVNQRRGGDSSRFVSHGEATLWMIMIAVQAGFWATVTGYTWTMARQYFPKTRRDLERVAGSVAVIFVLLVGVPFAARVGQEQINPLWGAGWKIPLLTTAGFLLVGLPSLLGILGTQSFSIRHLGATIEDSDLERYVELRDDLNRFLALLGTTIGLAVLASGALRNAVLAADPSANLPAEAVLEYGGFLTVLVAFAYAPANHALSRLGVRIRDELLPPRPPPKDPGFAGWYSTRKNLTELLQLDVGAYQRLQTAVLILSPLVSAALSLAIPKTS